MFRTYYLPFFRKPKSSCSVVNAPADDIDEIIHIHKDIDITLIDPQIDGVVFFDLLIHFDQHFEGINVFVLLAKRNHIAVAR